MNSDQTNSRRKLVNEDRWSRTYQIGAHEVYESKFTTGTAFISFRELSKEWATWTEQERLRFVLAFRAKSQLYPEDEKIIEFLLSQGDQHIWVNLAICLTRHSNKEMAFQFLLQQAKSAERDRRSFFHALALLGDKRALPTLRSFYLKNLKHVQDANAQLDDDARDFLMSCVALWKLTGEEDYLVQLGLLRSHPSLDIRKQATLLLDIWQPQPE